MQLQWVLGLNQGSRIKNCWHSTISKQPGSWGFVVFCCSLFDRDCLAPSPGAEGTGTGSHVHSQCCVFLMDTHQGKSTWASAEPVEDAAPSSLRDTPVGMGGNKGSPKQPY